MIVYNGNPIILIGTLSELPSPNSVTSDGTIFHAKDTSATFMRVTIAGVKSWQSLAASGSGFPLTSNVSAAGFKIQDLGAPTPGSNDAANALYVDTGIRNSFGVPNVRHYGALGDGTTDDGPAFQAAVNAAATTGSTELWVPDGRYLITTPVLLGQIAPTFLFQGLRVRGTGSGSVILCNTITNGVFTGANLYETVFDSLSFQGIAGRFADCFAALYLASGTYLIEECEFFGIGSTFANVFVGNASLKIRNTRFFGSASSANADLFVQTGNLDADNVTFVDVIDRPGIFPKVGNGPNQTIPPAWASVVDPPLAVAQLATSFRRVFFDENATQWLTMSSSGINFRNIVLDDINGNAGGNWVTPVVDISNADDVLIDKFVSRQGPPGQIQRSAIKLSNTTRAVVRKVQIATIAVDANTIEAAGTVGSLLLEDSVKGTNYRTLTSAASSTIVRPVPDGAPYTTIARPAAGDVPGLRIYNTTTNKQNFSDGTDWRDAAGAVV